MLDSRRVLTFCEVARRRSFSDAAAALSLTQPAVSQQIRALETQLGGRLIERRRGVFELTPAGELLFAHAEALSDRLQLAETQLAEAVAASRKRLRLGAFPSALATLVPAAVQRLHSSTADLELSVAEGGAGELVDRIHDGSLHVALCFEDAADTRHEYPATRRHELFDEPMLAAISTDHRLAGRARIRLSELAGDTWLAATRDGLIRRSCLAAGFEPRLRYLTSDPLAIRSLVAAGLAVTLTPQLLAPDLSAIRILPLLGAGPRRAVYALTPAVGVQPLVVPFLAALRDEACRLGLRHQP
jgi:DNA-binding transcriptional LysR family regulator